MTFLLLILAILPSFLLACWLYFQDLHQKEHTRHLVYALGVGVLSVLLTLAVASLLPDIQSAFYQAFIVAATVEESAKFIVFMIFIYPKSYFNEPYDGILFVAFVGLAFATIENVVYVLDGGLSTAIVRMFMAVPAHTIFGICIGYFAGLAKFNASKSLISKQLTLAKGLVLAIVLHGLYDWFLMQNHHEALGLMSCLIVFFGFKACQKAIAIHQNKSLV